MSAKSVSIAAIGFTAISSPLLAQEFYSGFSLSHGTFDTAPESGVSWSNLSTDMTSANIFGGVRFENDGGFFVGAELQGTTRLSDGINTDLTAAFDDNGTVAQAEVHLGFTTGNVRVFGFIGAGRAAFKDSSSIEVNTEPTVLGAGAEFDLGDNVAVRIEAEFSTMSAIDSCSSPVEFDIEERDISAGLVFSF